MPDPLAHPKEMTTLPVLRVQPLPRLWWLWPWPIVADLHQSLRFYGMITDLDDRIIRRQERDIKELNAIILRQSDIIRGKSSNPDAE